MPSESPETKGPQPAAQQPQILWIQNTVEHYFTSMIDSLNRQTAGMRFHAVFLCQRPDSLPAERLPKESTYSFLPDNLQHGPIAKGPLAKIPFSAAVVGGYDTGFKRRLINYCNKTRRPAILFADSNIRSERGKTTRKRLKRLAKQMFLRNLCPKLSAIIPCNRLGVAYWRYYGAPSARICRSTYFCDTDKISTAAGSNGNDLRQRYGIPLKARLIFTAARLVPAKALDLMAQAFANCQLAEKDWTWVVAGTGPLRDELARQARQSAGDAIKFLGFVPPQDVKALARHSELFVLPSIYEPHGIVVSEALAVGTPVIASDVCGAAGDLVLPEKTGWIFKNGSAESLTSTLATATASNEKLLAMRPDCQRGFREWNERYNPVRRAPEIIAELLNRRGK